MKEAWIVFLVEEPNDNETYDCDYGLVRLTPELLKELERRVIRFQSTIRHDDFLSEMRYWSPHCVYYNSSDVTNVVKDNLHVGDVLMLANKPSLASKTGERVDCSELVVSADGEVQWTAMPKYTNAIIKTTPVPIAKLKKMFLAVGPDQHVVRLSKISFSKAVATDETDKALPVVKTKERTRK